MGESYYRILDGVKFDRQMLDFCDSASKEEGFTKLTTEHAQTLFELITDGNRYTEVEKKTTKYIRDNYKWTEEADEWFRKSIRTWAAQRGDN